MPRSACISALNTPPIASPNPKTKAIGSIVPTLLIISSLTIPIASIARDINLQQFTVKFDANQKAIVIDIRKNPTPAPRTLPETDKH